MANVISTITADIDSGGWEASGVVWNDADSIDYGMEVSSYFRLYAGGGWEDLPRPAFVGHLYPDPWRKTFQTSEAPWKAFTAHELMKQGQIQGIYYTTAGTPTNRHQIIDLSFAYIVYEIMGGHCNLVAPEFGTAKDTVLWGTLFTTTPNQNGFMALNIDYDNSAIVESYEVKDGGFWQRLIDIANKEYYVVFVDKTNTFNYIPHPMFNDPLPDIIMTITKEMLLEPLRIERRNTELMGQLILYGSKPSGEALTAVYPTDPQTGPIIRRSGYLIDSNTDLTGIATRQFLFETRGYTVEAEIGNGAGLLLELLDRVAITYTSSADGIAWSNEPFYVHKIQVDLMDDFRAKTTLVLEQENAV